MIDITTTIVALLPVLHRPAHARLMGDAPEARRP